jgi:hypothetical protein
VKEIVGSLVLNHEAMYWNELGEGI